MARDIQDVLFPRIEESAAVVLVIPAGHDPDLSYCLQLGAAVWFNKPILALSSVGAPEIPIGIKRIAAQVLEQIDMANPLDQQRVSAALTAIGLGPV